MKKTNKKKPSYKKKRNHLKEFSKIIITIIIFIWLVVMVYGLVLNSYFAITSPEQVEMAPYYEFIGIPITGGILGYLIKAATENKQKIKNNKTKTLIDNNDEAIDENNDDTKYEDSDIV